MRNCHNLAAAAGLSLAMLLCLAGCNAQAKVSALPTAETRDDVQMTDDHGQPRVQEVHEYRLGGVELESR
jgi:hypothetical protein